MIQNHRLSTFLVAASLGSAAIFVPGLAKAETVQTCAGFIDTLPATITTQGVWCLRKDVSTSITTGAAITVATNNVTIDCNNFKLGGLAAGDATLALGVQSVGRSGTSVRNCSIRGFYRGVSLAGSAQSVGNSLFEQNTQTGIYIVGTGAVVRGNRVFDTGGSTDPAGASKTAHGIFLQYDNAMEGEHLVLDNYVAGVAATSGSSGSAIGILSYIRRGVVANNTVSTVQGAGGGWSFGISNRLSPGSVVFRENNVLNGTSTKITGVGLECFGALAKDNVVKGFVTGADACVDAGGNYMP
jgi:hypothetical protein